MLYKISDFLLTVFIGNYINIDQFGDELENNKPMVYVIFRLTSSPFFCNQGMNSKPVVSEFQIK